MKTTNAWCPGCKKNTTHTQNIKIWKGTYGRKDLIGKEYDAGWKCDECGCEWDSL